MAGWRLQLPSRSRWFWCSKLSSVIPVLVTGIQCAVSTAREISLVLQLKQSFHGADAPWLDPRHKGEDDG